MNLDVKYSKNLYTFFHGLLIISAASIPSILLNAPVGIAAKWWAEKQQVKALANSRVKIAATDVLLSNKISFTIVAVPTLWLTYFVLLWFFSGWQPKTIVLLFLMCPLLSYVGIKSVEATMTDLKDLRPAFLRLLPSFSEQVKAIPQQRAVVQKHVRAAVKKYGPSLGPLYLQKQSSAWEAELRRELKSKSSGAKLLKKLEEEHEESADEEDEHAASAGSAASPRATREGARVPTGIKRFKDE